MKYTGERVVPWNPATGWIMQRHTMRYAWAMGFCQGKAVIDLGCGTGYGTYILSWTAKDVTGLDVDYMSIEFARANFRADNIRYQPWDITDVLRHFTTDVWVAFEVLEHLDDPLQLVANLSGLLLWSVPLHDGSQFHKRVYNEATARREFGGRTWWQTSDGLIHPEKPMGATVNLLGAVECG
jgi:2-polyprenyl-3-methyl-5-hydroxy-6-metoxy-1,4-benzoquinol methylase